MLKHLCHLLVLLCCADSLTCTYPTDLLFFDCYELGRVSSSEGLVPLQEQGQKPSHKHTQRFVFFRRNMIRTLLVCGGVASGVASAYFVHRAWQDFLVNDVLISVNEFVSLSQVDTQSFTDLSSAVEGEIRVSCNLTSTYKFLLRLNAWFTEAGNMMLPRGGRSRRGRVVDASSPGGSADDLVPLSNVEVNEIVDTFTLDKKQQLQFSPACCSHQALLRYKTRLHETFVAPVSAKDVTLSNVSPGTLSLTFTLLVHASILDLEVLITLPKKTRVLSIDHGKVGTWHPVSGASREVVWMVGNCGTGNGARAEVASMATVATHVQQRQEKLFGKKMLQDHTNDTQAAVSPEVNLPDETVVLPNLVDYPQAEMGSYMERLHFEMTYIVEDEEQTTAAPSRRRREDVADDSVGGVPRPAVCLTYGIATTVSSLTVKKLSVMEERKNWDASNASFVWRLAKRFLPVVDGGKLCKKAQYTTRLVQTVKVDDAF